MLITWVCDLQVRCRASAVLDTNRLVAVPVSPFVRTVKTASGATAVQMYSKRRGVSGHRARGVGARYERLDISSSNFPLYDRNSNIGGFSATEAPEIVVGLAATPPDYPARVASRFTVELAGRLAERGDADVRFAHVWRVRAMRGYYEGLSPPLPAGTPAARCKA